MPNSEKNEAKPRTDSAQNGIVVSGIELQWNLQAGTCTFNGLPVAMLWLDSTMAGLMSGLATMVGPERFSLALQSEGRKSVESDWLLMSRYPAFREGFAAIAVVAGVAGWGEWQLIEEQPDRQACRFRAYNTWEGLYQSKLKACWGSAMLAGKLAGYCTRRFGTNCWATQTSFIAKGDPCDEFTVAPSPRLVEDEIQELLNTDQATRADMAVALVKLRAAQSQLLAYQGTLEILVRQRTGELTASLDQLKIANDRLQREVEEHTRAEKALRRSEALTMMIIEHAPMSMALVDINGTIEFINQKAIETFGFHPEDIPSMDQWWLKAYPRPEWRQDARTRWMRYVTQAIRDGREIQRDDYKITCKDGTVKTVSAFGVPLEDKILVMFDDITLRALREDLLLRSNAELESRVQERTAELAERNRSLEHTTSQLRKLGSKLTRVEENERKRMAQILHDQLQQKLVAAQFSLSALEHGLTGNDRLAAAGAVSQALDEALQESRSLVQELSPPILREGGLAMALKWVSRRMHEKHGLAVTVDVDPRVRSFGEDLRDAIFNAVRELLLNVIKHSGAKTAEVSITILPDARARIVVADRGRGYRPSPPGQSEDLDLGFGLVAVRERIESLGGSMAVDSAPGQGCRVTLIGPIAPSPDDAPDLPDEGTVPTAGVAVKGERTASGTRIRVLLVDDHTLVRQGLGDRLSRDPLLEVVGQAADGEAAVHQARALRPDVVLMDFSMPKMNGVEATRLIHAEFPDMIVIGLSMYEEPHRAEEMHRAGASAYVVKSQAAEILVETIHTCCKR